MILFSPQEAKHFCVPLVANIPGQIQSLKGLHESLKLSRLIEGTPTFDVHRVSLLTSVDRWLLYGLGNYRRAFDMFIPVAAPWAHVTLYYSSYFAANALLGMFGCWVDNTAVVEVETGTPNQQSLKIQRKPKSGPTGYKGSHQLFWDFFYEACTQLYAWVPKKFHSAITPVNNDRVWQILARNEVNYDTLEAHQAAILFHLKFNPQRLRPSLFGALRQQLEVTESMLGAAVHFANDFGVGTFGLDGFGIPGKRKNILRAMVSKSPPSIVGQSALQPLLA